MTLPTPSHRCGLSRLLAVTALMSTCSAFAQQEKKDAQPVDLNEILISAPKLSQDLLKAPLSATVTTGKTIQDANMQTVKDAALYSPNTYFTDFSARKLSTPRIRGIGGSPYNPGVTTYIDGVPHFNSYSSSITLLDVEQVDVLRGPMGPLFGRNTAGGLINITSRRPAMHGWEGDAQATIGNYNTQDYRARLSGALIEDVLGVSAAVGYNQRDGYTKNSTNGQPIDNRGSWFGKTQFLWTPDKRVEMRFIIAGESARDGDYGLNDLGALRSQSRMSARDTVGYTKRDVLMPTFQFIYHFDTFDFTSTTGLVWWRTEDQTDLDYSNGQFFPGAGPLMVRNNNERQTTWTQEFRFSSAKDKPVFISDSAFLTWQAGVFLFDQTYQQATAQTFNVGALVPTNTSADLHDQGMGLYAQSTLTLWKNLDLTAGLRWDYEHRQANLTSSGGFPIPLPAVGTGTARSFNQVTPQAALSYRFTPGFMAYFALSGGYKAGGFNTASLAGRTFYDEERSWNYELGFKGRALQEKLGFQLAFFYTDWRNLQLNSPNGASVATYDIINAGNAASKGIELSLNYEATSSWTLFGSAGLQSARFLSGSTDNLPGLFGGTLVPVGGNRIPYSPGYTVALGSMYSFELGGGYSLYARGDVQFMGGFTYDSINAAGQDCYSLANFRLGVRNDRWFTEAFINNAFNTKYYPTAIPYPGLAPSGYVGESGNPMTFGVRAGVKF